MYVVFEFDSLLKKTKRFPPLSFPIQEMTIGKNPDWPTLSFLVPQYPAHSLLIKIRAEIEVTIKVLDQDVGMAKPPPLV